MRHSVEEIVLSNGMRGLLIDVPEATVMNFRFHVRAGDYFAPVEQYEAAHIMEHMVLGANERYRTARKFNEEFDKNGAYNNAMTGPVSMHYIAECADFEAMRIADLLTLAISKPYFTSEEFEAEYGNVQEEFTGRLNNYPLVLACETNRAFDATDRYRTDSERLDIMKNVDIASVRAHYKKTHHSDNMRFIIAGRMQGRKKQIVQILEDMELSRGERFAYPAGATRHLPAPVYIDRQDVKNILFEFTTHRLRRLTEQEEQALSTVNIMLTATLHSMILGEAREKGLVYSMGSYYDVGINDSSWEFAAQVGKNNSEPLFDVMVKHLGKLLAGDIDKERVEMAKQYRLGLFQMGAQTVGSLVRGYGSQYFYDDTVLNYDEEPDKIKAVTKTQMVKVAQEMFSDQVWGLGVLSNCGEETAEKLRRKLEALWH